MSPIHMTYINIHIYNTNVQIITIIYISKELGPDSSFYFSFFVFRFITRNFEIKSS